MHASLPSTQESADNRWEHHRQQESAARGACLLMLSTEDTWPTAGTVGHGGIRSADYTTWLASDSDDYAEVTEENTLRLRKYTQKYLTVKGHHACNVSPNPSENNMYTGIRREALEQVWEG